MKTGKSWKHLLWIDEVSSCDRRFYLKGTFVFKPEGDEQDS